MLTTTRIVMYLIVGVLVTNCVTTLQNLSHSKKEVVNYYESGEYEAELRGIISEIKNEFANYSFSEKDAVIFDVDETSLSNYKYIKSIDFGYESDLWNDYILNGNAEPIKPILELYNWFKDKKVKLIFLTGRTGNTFEATKRNLINDGYNGFDTLICRNNETKKLPAHIYKSSERKKLVEKGYNIIANIGDLNSDHLGGYTGEVIKLPNYIYDF